MPHRGRMRLIESVHDSCTNRIVCVARDHRGADHPLRLRGRLFSATLTELGAQAAALHASIHAIAGAHSGMVLALRDVTILRPQPAGCGRLHVLAEKQAVIGEMAVYGFEVREEEALLIKGDVMLSIKEAGA